MSDNIDQLPEEGSAYLKPSTPARVFIYIGNNEAREKGVIEKPNDSDFYEYEPNPNKGGVIGFDLDRYKEACRQYEERLESLPRIKVYPPFAGTLKEGQELIEGKDFEEQWLLSYGQGAAWHDKALYDHYNEELHIQDRRIIASSTPPVKEEERSDAVEFAEWVANSFYCIEKGKWIDSITDEGAQVYSTSELYQLFNIRNK